MVGRVGGRPGGQGGGGGPPGGPPEHPGPPPRYVPRRRYSGLEFIIFSRDVFRNWVWKGGG